ncbi:hypothetical protein K458DRAFT_397542 [Lentithecium fluviatile CBS 122367]|uniref:Uncharacterized protein n=1 Tax=Lentithecium fluviatile CBS 122367 TaxID=1168545 RepID=A0A6G1ICD0_9PLEO|nr:hypothetical protein K458DRAFT_397542 [Lentithecium fluviatile CBS 122367]
MEAQAAFPVVLSVAEAKEAFEVWVQNVTSVEIQNLFLKSLTSGCNDVLSKVVEPTELAHFNDLVADFDITPDGQIEVYSIIKYLAVEYPWHICRKNLIRLRPITDFVPLVERLELSSLDPSWLGPLPVSILEPLRDLAEAFPPRYEEPAADLGVGGADTLTIEEFCYWAKKIRLLEALDQLFSVFVPKAKCQCPKHRATEEKVVVDTSDSDA